MTNANIFNYLKEIGCCNLCAVRHLGSKNPDYYADVNVAFEKLKLKKLELSECGEEKTKTDSEDEPTTKKARISTCVCCLGLLQEDKWPEMIDVVKNEVTTKGYESETFACALSYPMAIHLREYSISIVLKEKFPFWDADCVTSLKEGWKWSFCPLLGKAIEKTMDSGAVCQFFIKVFTIYDNETEELETLRSMAPLTFAERAKCHRKFRGESFTRKAVENILSDLETEVFRTHFKCPPQSPNVGAKISHAECCHNSIYIAGRYCKYSRELCQTPWLLDGKRMMESSIQDIIFEPIIAMYKIPIDDVNTRLKFLSSGREDVDVRCLGEGRPFAVEVLDPIGPTLPFERLRSMEKQMSATPELVTVQDLQIVNRDKLTILKMAEETKTKTYLALCVKLPDQKQSTTKNGTDQNEEIPIHSDDTMTETDMKKINCLTIEGSVIDVKQKTPLRVLHRRPLLVRDRRIHSLDGAFIEGKPNLFTVKLTTQAGTYIKEFVHGDFGRTTPNLTGILGFKVDILALDVLSVNVDWPKKITADMGL